MIDLLRLARTLRIAWNVAATAGVMLLVVEYGFRLPAWVVTGLHVLEFLVVTLFVADAMVQWAMAPEKRSHAREHRLELVLVGLLAAGILGAYVVWPGGRTGETLRAMELPTVGTLVVGTIQVYFLARLLISLTGLQERIAARQVRPPVIMILSFLGVILVGTLLLWLPKAAAPGRPPIAFVDAVFTATSATCVTGLATRDTGTDFSTTGQFIILLLIQVGGLGLVFFTAFFLFLQQRSLGLRHLVMIREVLSFNVIGEMGRYLKYVVLVTLTVEALGAALLWISYDASSMAPGVRLRWCVFHSVSAFCNAGFALSSTSFVEQAGNVGLNLTLAALIVAGGLGFPVMMNLLSYRPMWLSWIRRRRLSAEAAPSPSRLTLQSRLAIGVSALLIAGGAGMFWLMERGGALSGRPAGEQATASAFQSVSARTAGFNTVDLSKLATPTLLVLMVLMAIGASPASTGGGIKTITFAVLGGTVWSMMRNRVNVEMFRRTIPRLLVNAAVTIAVLYGIEVLVVSMLLTALEPSLEFREILFETVSALSTVGLSTGITATLGAPAKLVLCGAMLAGRVGPLVILMSLAGRATSANYEYPQEDVIVA